MMQMEMALWLTSAVLSSHVSTGFLQPCPTVYPSSSLQKMMNKRTSSQTGKSSGGGFAKKVPIINLRTKKKRTDFIYTGSMRPYPQTPQSVVDPSAVIAIPDYAFDGVPKKKGPPGEIEIKSAADIEKMRAAGRVAREVLDIGGAMIAEGVTTDEIDAAVYSACLERKAYPSPLNYRNFPKSCCTSINEVICHGIPDTRPLQAGDIVNLDITVYLDGYHGDCSEMFVVGGKQALDEEGQKLIQTTYDSWLKAMECVKPGTDYNAIGRIIQDYVTPKGYSTVRSFCGHGIGTVFHMAPNIYHYTINESLSEMKEGHVFTIEPMICEGLSNPYMWEDDWTATTGDGRRSAQFEHTLVVTDDGVEAFTGKIETSPLQFWEEESSVSKGIWLGTSNEARRKAEELNKKKLKHQ